MLASLRIAVAVLKAAESSTSERQVPPLGIRIPDAARKELGDTLEANGAVPQYLLKKNELPSTPPSSFRPGSEYEAVLTAMDLIKAWEATPGARRPGRRERAARPDGF